jgi:hypothetical protein
MSLWNAEFNMGVEMNREPSDHQGGAVVMSNIFKK